jgi:hypothetical protein
MRLEERVESALRAQTEVLPPVPTDLSAIRSAARAQSRRHGAIGLACVAAVVGVVLAAGVTDLGRDQSRGVAPVAPSSATPTPSATDLPGPIDTTDWESYTSTVYGFQVRRPLGWSVDPADRPWRLRDLPESLGPGYDTFRSPPGDVGVGMFSAPLEPGTRIESTADIEAWVADYCRASQISRCTGIHERAVPLCVEERDCHPGLLVPFENDVQAFFSGGIYDAGAMTVVAVWRPEADSSVAPYGGSRRLLEAFLSTMDVWPAPRSGG